MTEVTIITRMSGHLVIGYHGPVCDIPLAMDSARVYFLTEHDGSIEIQVLGGVVCCSNDPNDLFDAEFCDEELEEELPFA